MLIQEKNTKVLGNTLIFLTWCLYNRSEQDRTIVVFSDLFEKCALNQCLKTHCGTREQRDIYEPITPVCVNCYIILQLIENTVALRGTISQHGQDWKMNVTCSWLGLFLLYSEHKGFKRLNINKLMLYLTMYLRLFKPCIPRGLEKE